MESGLRRFADLALEQKCSYETNPLGVKSRTREEPTILAFESAHDSSAS